MKAKPPLRVARLPLVWLLCAQCAFAEIPEPDHLIYGSILLGTNAVTAADTHVIIEARRTTNGPALASYRMGDDAGLGNFYALALKFESVGSVVDEEASAAGQEILIVLLEGGQTVGQAAYTFGTRGAVRRVDFGAPLDDADGNGLPDLWELGWLGATGQDPAALGLNGQSLMDNYITGTDPRDPDDLFELEINRTSGPVQVAFVARRAEGPGYTGRVRSYTLESQSPPGSGDWAEVEGLAGVTGDNQRVIHTATVFDPAALYRGRVSLATVQVPGGPVLSIEAVAPGQVRLSWPSAFVGFALQENPVLNGSTWTDVSAAATDDGTRWSVLLSAPDGSRFYRLRQ